MKIAVIGTGYVGLVTGAGFSELGHDVICVDADAGRVRGLEMGEIPFHEPDLPGLVTRNMRAGRLRFATSTAGAVAGVHVVFVTVGTPPSPAGDLDMQYIEAAIRDICRGLAADTADARDADTVVVIKSTAAVGTTERMAALIREQTGRDVAVAVNPEFLREGNAVHDFMHPQRVIIGTGKAGRDRARALLHSLYRPMVDTVDHILHMDTRSAELAKYAANTMLAARISLMNELALVAEAVDADIEHVRRAAGADARIGADYLCAGAGFGGSCLPKDVGALVHLGKEAGVDMTMASAVQAVNARQTRLLAARVIESLGPARPGGEPRRVAIWGLSFKPGTDDIRRAPALALIDHLLQAGVNVVAYDPVAGERVRARLGHAIEVAEDMYAAARGADVLVVVTEWPRFRRPDFACLARVMRAPVLVDGRNIWDPDHVRGLGFTYYGVGRGRPVPARQRYPGTDT